MADSHDIQELGRRIDFAVDKADVDALKSLDIEAEEHLGVGAEPDAIIHYFRANIAAGLRGATGARKWEWRQPYLEREIRYLRLARSDSSFQDLKCLRRAQITTNLANTMNTLGRPIEAGRLYEKALSIIPNFGMAIANRGLARLNLSRMLYDLGHAKLIMAYACRDFEAVQMDTETWQEDYQHIVTRLQKNINHIHSIMDVDTVTSVINSDKWDVGVGLERDYRKRILKMGLFLNPLNMLGPLNISATDVLHLPSHGYGLSEPPHYLAWYNQLKQEYITARLLYHEAMNGSPMEDKETHFADRDVRLVDTLDYPAFSVAVEKLRLSFRSAYSLLDKIAGFLNTYYKLGSEPQRVGLRGIWYSDSRKRQELRPEFTGRQNLPLRGLFWLSFDILGEVGADDTIAPEAAHLNDLRNLLEHRCLVLTTERFTREMKPVEHEELFAFLTHTERMLELVHEALMLLSLSMHAEERQRKATRFDTELYLPDLGR